MDGMCTFIAHDYKENVAQGFICVYVVNRTARPFEKIEM